MIGKLMLALAGAGLLLQGTAALGAVEYKIVTASARGTYIQIGRNLAEFVAPQADIALEALPSAGSAENVKRLRYEAGVKLALVQSDVYQAFLDQAAAGSSEARDMIRPLRVILPLYNEEIQFIVRQDSPLNYVHEIKEAKINAGELGSGTALTTTTLYRLMFNGAIPQANASYLSNEDALVKLTTDKSVDVVAVIAGQPAKLLSDMTPEARKLIKLLKFDAANPATAAALKTYFPATIRAASYPNLLPADIPGAAVKAFLVTYDYKLGGAMDRLRAFGRSLCQNFPKLQAEGHPKWREVQLTLPDLPQGWQYYSPMQRELKACIADMQSRPPPLVCTQQAKILGLCK